MIAILQPPHPQVSAAHIESMSAARAACTEIVALCLGAALEQHVGSAAGAGDDAGIGVGAGVSALVTVRVTEATTLALSGERAVACVGVDVLGQTCGALPGDSMSLLSALTGYTRTHAEWATSLSRAGIRRLDIRTAGKDDAAIRCYAMLVPSTDTIEREVEKAEGKPWQAPLIAVAGVPKPEEMCGGGFQIELHLSSASDDDEAAPALTSAACVNALEVLVRASALLLPACDVQLVLAGAEAENEQSEQPTERIIVALSGVSSALPLLERMLRVQNLWRPPAAVEDEAMDAAAPTVLVASGQASEVFGTGNKRVTWSVDVLLVHRAREVPTPPTVDAMDVAKANAALPGARVVGASLFCFNQSSLLHTPQVGVLGALRAKSTAADLKEAFGLMVRGCDVQSEEEAINHSAGACALLRYAQGTDADAVTVRPETMVVHRRCFTLQGGALSIAGAALGRNNEARLFKAALMRALMALKAASGGALASPFERGLHSHGLPALSRAMSRIMLGGPSPSMHELAAALVQRDTAPAEDEQAGSTELELSSVGAAHKREDAAVTPARVEQAICAALLRVLDLQHQARATKKGPPDEGGAVDDEADEELAPEVGEEDPDEPSLDAWRASRRGRSPESSWVDTQELSDAEAEAIFPTGKRQSTRVEPAQQTSPGAAAESPVNAPAEDEGWLL